MTKKIKRTKNSKRSPKKIKIIKKVKKQIKKIVEIKPEKTKHVSVIDIKVKEPKPKGVVYFTKETEQAIIDYNHFTDRIQKDIIYTSHIHHAFEKIAENIYNTFKFSYADVSPLEIQKQCISHMVANIDKYEPGKGKAFSYFSIVAKHWFILDNNNTYRRFKRHVEICEHPGDAGEFVVESEHHNKNKETCEFIRLMVEFWDVNVGKYFNKERDLKIANAVIEIFRNSDRIDVFNKKALYLYIREIADCQTQHITKIIGKMKQAQQMITNEYRESGTISSSED